MRNMLRSPALFMLEIIGIIVTVISIIVTMIDIIIGLKHKKSNRPGQE